MNTRHQTIKGMIKGHQVLVNGEGSLGEVFVGTSCYVGTEYVVTTVALNVEQAEQLLSDLQASIRTAKGE